MNRERLGGVAISALTKQQDLVAGQSELWRNDRIKSGDACMQVDCSFTVRAKEVVMVGTTCGFVATLAARKRGLEELAGLDSALQGSVDRCDPNALTLCSAPDFIGGQRPGGFFEQLADRLGLVRSLVHERLYNRLSVIRQENHGFLRWLGRRERGRSLGPGVELGGLWRSEQSSFRSAGLRFECDQAVARQWEGPDFQLGFHNLSGRYDGQEQV